jgi:hypothetical protein
MHVGRKSIAREEVSILKIKKGSTGKNLTGEISAGYAYTHTHTHTHARARAHTRTRDSQVFSARISKGKQAEMES